MDIEAGPTQVELALDAWSTALDHLVKVVEDGGLDAVDDLGLVAFLRGVEQVRNRSALADHRAIRDAERRRLADTLTQPHTAAVLSWALQITKAEARRRVRAAEQLSGRLTPTGERLDPLRPQLAEAQRRGESSPERIDIALRALESVDHRGFDPADVDAGEQLLAQYAVTFAPAELRLLAAQVVDRIDPDGSVPDDELNTARRHLRLRLGRDGAWSGDFRLTGPAGAKLSAVLGPLAAPQPATLTLADGQTVEEPDPRHHVQRMHDALEDACDRLLRAGGLPESGGTPATVIVTIDADDLTTQSGWGVTSTGARLSAAEVCGLATQADVYPTVVEATGVVLNLGRTRRCASPGQTAALIARDGGCSFPGCDRPPECSERHHVVFWAHGGLTDLDNLTLLCGYHHRQFLARGWTCRIIDGLPHWIPPRWVDPHQRPLLHDRIVARTVGRRLRC